MIFTIGFLLFVVSLAWGTILRRAGLFDLDAAYRHRDWLVLGPFVIGWAMMIGSLCTLTWRVLP